MLEGSILSLPLYSSGPASCTAGTFLSTGAGALNQLSQVEDDADTMILTKERKSS